MLVTKLKFARTCLHITPNKHYRSLMDNNKGEWGWSWLMLGDTDVKEVIKQCGQCQGAMRFQGPPTICTTKLIWNILCWGILLISSGNNDFTRFWLQRVYDNSWLLCLMLHMVQCWYAKYETSGTQTSTSLRDYSSFLNGGQGKVQMWPWWSWFYQMKMLPIKYVCHIMLQSAMLKRPNPLRCATLWHMKNNDRN